MSEDVEEEDDADPYDEDSSSRSSDSEGSPSSIMTDGFCRLQSLVSRFLERKGVIATSNTSSHMNFSKGMAKDGKGQ